MTLQYASPVELLEFPGPSSRIDNIYWGMSTIPHYSLPKHSTSFQSGCSGNEKHVTMTTGVRSGLPVGYSFSTSPANKKGAVKQGLYYILKPLHCDSFSLGDTTL